MNLNGSFIAESGGARLESPLVDYKEAFKYIQSPQFELTSDKIKQLNVLAMKLLAQQRDSDAFRILRFLSQRLEEEGFKAHDAQLVSGTFNNLGCYYIK